MRSPGRDATLDAVHLPASRHAIYRDSGLACANYPACPATPTRLYDPRSGHVNSELHSNPVHSTFKWPGVGATTANSRSKRRLDDYANLSFALTRLNTRSFPDVERATIVVGVTWRGTSAQDVAGAFTAPFKHELLLTSPTTIGTSSPQRRGHAVSKLAKS